MVELDPYSREYTENPYPIYRRLRSEAPVYYNPTLNFWALSRYQDVVDGLKDTTNYSSTGGVSVDSSGAGVPALILKDPPQHSWHKALVSKVFTRSRMESLDPFIRNRSVELLEELGQREEFDFVQEFSMRLPLDVISELIGIPHEYRDRVHELIDISLSRDADGGNQASLEAFHQQHLLFLELLELRKKKPMDDPITLLMNVETEDENGNPRKLSDLEIAIHFGELAAAGHETVAKAIPNALMAMHQFPDERVKMQANASGLVVAVEEVLRWEPPSQMQGRTTTRDVDIRGTVIPEGSKVMMINGSACRDETVFPDPDRFISDRVPDIKSLPFGFGVHKCLGIHLARTEVRIALEEIFRRFPNYEIDPARAIRPVVQNVRGVSQLPIRPGPHAAI